MGVSAVESRHIPFASLAQCGDIMATHFLVSIFVLSFLNALYPC